MSTKGDRIVEGGADKLDTLADKAAAKGGVGGKVADELADDANFLRKLKPSLIVARAKGEAPKDGEPGTARRSPGTAQLPREPKARAEARIRSSSPGPRSPSAPCSRS